MSLTAPQWQVAVLCILFPIFNTVKPIRHGINGNKLYMYHTKRHAPCHPLSSTPAVATLGKSWVEPAAANEQQCMPLEPVGPASGGCG